MNILYSHHEGSQAVKPLALDTASSKTAVYLRKNIEQITRTDPMTGESMTLWSYDEAKLTPAEYEQYKSEAAAELIAKVGEDNLSLMDALATVYEQQITTEENQLTIMSAMADLYDAISEITK